MSRTKGYKCFNIECGSCIGKTLCGEPEDTALGCASRVVGKPMTNADRNRAMSDKELARFLASVENRRSADGGGAQWCGIAHALKWLQQPAEEVSHD